MNHLPENPEKTEGQPSDQGFLQRWSQRKAAGPELAEPDLDPAGDLPPADAVLAPLQPADDSDKGEDAELPVLTDEDMPPLETLNADSDYAPFMSEGVSSELRQLALKKLFFSGLFGKRDGLDDYDDDFTRFEPLGDTITSDMKFHMRREEKARLAKEEAEREAQEQEQTAGSDAPEANESATEAQGGLAESETDEAPTDAAGEPDNPVPARVTPDQQAPAEDQLANHKSDEPMGNNS